MYETVQAFIACVCTTLRGVSVCKCMFMRAGVCMCVCVCVYVCTRVRVHLCVRMCCYVCTYMCASTHNTCLGTHNTCPLTWVRSTILHR